MKRKDVISFLGMVCYITLVFGGLHIYFTPDRCHDENRSACIQQNSTIDTKVMIDYSETNHF